MQFRTLGRTGYSVSSISFGAWAIGGSWGNVSDDDALRALHRYVELGGNFIDTADVYGDGRSERLIARLRAERPGDTILVATKAGRRLNPHTPEGYNRANLTAFVDRSLQNLRADSLDLLQLHCPPTPVYSSDEVYGVLDDLAAAGKLRHYGVSVETVDEATTAITHPNVKTVQIIFNVFRIKPTERFFPEARRRNVGILARVPLASGLLTGKLTLQSQFASDDHRFYNRGGEHFDIGETFSGVEFGRALQAVDELRGCVPAGMTMAQMALRWILMFDAVTCAIPGAKNQKQVEDNCAAGDLPPLPEAVMERCRQVYDRYIREQVHHRW